MNGVLDLPHAITAELGDTGVEPHATDSLEIIQGHGGDAWHSVPLGFEGYGRRDSSDVRRDRSDDNPGEPLIRFVAGEQQNRSGSPRLGQIRPPHFTSLHFVSGFVQNSSAAASAQPNSSSVWG